MELIGGRGYRSRSLAAVLGLTLLLGLWGCSGVKFVADYDATSQEQILSTGKEIDLFYGKMLETDQDKRPYKNYSDQYVTIEVDLRSLLTRNQNRPLNSESTRICQLLLSQWEACKGKHKAENRYSNGNATLDRDRFLREFASALSAENAKNIK